MKRLLTRKGVLSQRGFTLVMIVVALGVMSTTATALVGAMSTGNLGLRVVSNDATAARLAVSQMENTKSYTPYQAAPATYPSIAAPAGYTLTASASEITGYAVSSIEKITVTVQRGNVTVRTLEDYKGNR
ncbi:MAG: hypothetical protein HY261_11595 [Chloroflexi bacterium]|nr:hypothetical protein [Chloroflexota bacterium]